MKNNINIVVIGDVCAIDCYTDKQIRILDRMKFEKELGVNSPYQLESVNNYIRIVDVSGHRNFIKNMITGISKADCCVLMLSDTEELVYHQQINLVSNLGIKHLIIATMQENKEIRDKINPYIKKFEDIKFITISSDNEDNVLTLLETLDKVQSIKRLVDDPLRIPVKDVFKVNGIGTVVVGRIQTGVLRAGMNVYFAPGNITAEVRSLEAHYYIPEALPGYYIGFNIKNIPVKNIKIGMVVGSDNTPPRAVRDFIAEIVILNDSEKIIEGYTPMIDCHTLSVACKISEILSKIDRRSGNKLKSKQLRNEDCAIIKLIPVRPICVENFSDFQSLGRFIIRDMKRIIAVGIIIETNKSPISMEVITTS